MIQVLIAEDDAAVRQLLVRYLAHFGYSATCACDGEEAIASATTAAPDIIIMDMGMPVIDGWAAIGQLRALPQTAHIPIIALTAWASHDERQRGLAAGCDAYLTKPINFVELLQTITALLMKRRLR